MIPRRHNTAWQTLDMQYNQIGDVGAAAIGEGLRCVHDDCARPDFLLVVLCFLRWRWRDGRLHLIGVLDHPTVWSV